MSVVFHRWRGFAVAASSMAAMLVAPAHAADADAVERTRLIDERAATEARFAGRDEECRQRFVVSACVADARRDRRTALDALRDRQRLLDDARRRERAEERRAALAAKTAEDARRERGGSAAAASSPAAASAAASALRQGRPLEPRREPEPARSTKPSASRDRPPSTSGDAKKPSARVDPAGRQQLEERSRASFAARQKHAAQHRDDAAVAAIRRMEKHSPGQALAVPSASSVRAASAP